MSDRPSHNLEGLDVELARRIDGVCRRFEADWRAGACSPFLVRWPAVSEKTCQVVGENVTSVQTQRLRRNGTMHWTLHWPWPLWMIVVAAVAFCLGSSWMSYDIRRRYGPLAPVAISMLLVSVIIFIAGLPRKRDRDRVITLLAVLGGSGILIIAQTRKQQHYVRMISDWAGSQGFTAESESRTEGVETVPEPLRQLPLFRRACEPATGYVLSRDELSNRRTVLFEFETHQKTPQRWMWANHNYDVQRITVIAIRHAKLGLPAFELRSAAVAEPPLEDDPPWNASS